MDEKLVKLDKGIFLHIINTNKFKTNLLAAFLLTDLVKDEVTTNALIPSVLKRGTKNYKTIKEISNKMDDMYGAIFDASSDKIGDNQALQFYISTIDDEYALNHEKLLFESIDFMHELIFNPKTIDGKFDEEYVNGEKEMLRELIKSKINDKASYALYRCTEEMFKDEAYGVYKYGREEDLDKINAQNLYEVYQKLINTSEIHLYVVGKFDEKEIIEYMKQKFILNRNIEERAKKSFKPADFKVNDVRVVNDKQDVTQGKIVLGYEAFVNPSSEDYYKVMVYNAILGGSVPSKLFQIVREKMSLCYTIRSMFIKHKSVMFITAGVEMNKKEEALNGIKAQEEDMRKGNFSETDIEDAKVFLINLYKSYSDDATTLVDLSMGQYLLDMNFDINQIIENIGKVTKEDIVEVANKMSLKVEYFLGN